MLLPLLHDRDGVAVRAGGEVVTYIEANDQSKRDLLTMEAIALPLSFLVLIWVFGGVLAAAVPLAVGGFAIVGSIAMMRALASFTEVSIFALNLIIAMGLALAIDYTLLIVSRFRDEIADGAGRDEALLRTMATAGRTVLFSALTVSLAMATMTMFPMYFLKSLGYAGVAVVALAATAAIVVAPAAIAFLGPRIDSLDCAALRPPDPGAPDPLPRTVQQTFWYRWTKASSAAVHSGHHRRRDARFCCSARRSSGVKWGYPDDRVLPESASSRQVGDDMRAGFGLNSLTDLAVVIPDVTGVTPRDLDRYAADLSRVPDVAAVSAPGGTSFRCSVGAPTAPRVVKDGSAFFTVATDAPLYSAASERQLDMLHAVPAPAGRDVHADRAAQINRDSAAGVADTMPKVLMVIAVITFVLLFLLTGSVVLPLKALVLNMLSLTASFGALVWVFQEGHLGAFGTTSTGTMIAHVPALLFCLAFGLSMDYEVFLISRIREYWLESGGADNDEAVALGIARTGRVVTAAALLMALSFATLMAAQVSVMVMFGLGVTLAVLADATLVRMLLLPALMHLLGRYNWWAPAPLRALHRRIGLRESVAPGPNPLPASPSRCRKNNGIKVSGT